MLAPSQLVWNVSCIFFSLEEGEGQCLTRYPQAGFEVIILQPHPPKCYDSKCTVPQIYFNIVKGFHVNIVFNWQKKKKEISSPPQKDNQS